VLPFADRAVRVAACGFRGRHCCVSGRRARLAVARLCLGRNGCGWSRGWRLAHAGILAPLADRTAAPGDVSQNVSARETEPSPRPSVVHGRVHASRFRCVSAPVDLVRAGDEQEGAR
jgi:hypothetical protein